jgi:hypothetical protein
MREMEEQGLLVYAEFRARRAFEVEETEDEGLHFFVELEDGAVLYLNGQFLYEYVPDDEPECRQERQFPCTEFTTVRHRDYGYVVDLVCRGDAFAPEILAPAFTRADYGQGTAPADGDVIRHRAYDEIKAERLRTR